VRQRPSLNAFRSAAERGGGSGFEAVRAGLRDHYLRCLRSLPLTRGLFRHYDAMVRERDAALAMVEAAAAARDAALAGAINNDQISTPEYILWAYRLLLGREPEDPAGIHKQPPASRREIVQRFLASAEFRASFDTPEWVLEAKNQWLIVELADGTRFWICPDDRYISRGVIAGAYEPIETAFVRRHVKEGMIVLDIGANIGWYTVLMAKLVGAAGHVEAFEARDELADRLRRTVAENKLDNVSVHQCALAAVDGEGTIVISNDNFGAAHLIEPAATGGATQPVALRRLGSVISRAVDFIKIDVEGAEKLVFDGAGAMLRRDRPLILCEINDECLRRTSKLSSIEFQRYFAAAGYEMREVTSDGRCGARLTEADLAKAAGLVLNVGCIPLEKVAALTAG
jgi:FkbM family methyltransferase